MNKKPDRIIRDEHEREPGDQFLSIYNAAMASNYYILDQPAPPAPDLRCKNTVSKRILWLEISTIYPGDTAQAFWDRARGVRKKGGTLFIINPVRLITKEANRIIQQKSKKLNSGNYYCSDDTLFLVLNMPPIKPVPSDIEK